MAWLLHFALHNRFFLKNKGFLRKKTDAFLKASVFYQDNFVSLLFSYIATSARLNTSANCKSLPCGNIADTSTVKELPHLLV
jgi:hypothetical protein